MSLNLLGSMFWNLIKWWNTLNIRFGVWKFCVQIFFHFWEKLCHQNLAKTLLWAQISILEFSIVYPQKIGNFTYPMAYSKPKNSNSNYSKIAFKECKELWRGLYWLIQTLKQILSKLCGLENKMKSKSFILRPYTYKKRSSLLEIVDSPKCFVYLECFGLKMPLNVLTYDVPIFKGLLC